MSGKLQDLLKANGNQLETELVTKAYGTKMPQRRNPDADN
jgi:hypothetical protein